MPKLQKPVALPSVAKRHLTIDGPYRRHPRMMMWPSALVCAVVFAMLMWHVVASAGTATAAPAARLKAPATQPLPASTPTKPPGPQPKPSAPTKPSPSPQRQAAAASRTDVRRKAAIKAVKTCQRQLAMDDDTYRAMLQARTGKRSATELTLTELGVVLDHLRQAGANSHGIHADGRKRKAPAEDRQALYKKVCALLAALAKATGKPYTMSYADAICVRNGWCSRIDFANAEVLHRVVAALSRNLSRTTAAATAAQG